jgi:superfamily I DNA/RNA helicase
MVEERKSWLDAFQRKFKDKEKNYFRKLLKSEVNLDIKARIIIDTIHQVKGGEADNVVISAKCNFPSHFDRKNFNVVISAKCNFPSHFDRKNLDERIKELRVWYTGVTRSINTLHLLGTYHKYHFPLSKYYKLYKSNYV